MRTHVLRNMTPNLLALFVTNLGIGLGALIFIETIFGLPGLGNMFRVALRQHDLPVTAGIVMLATTTVLVLTLVADLVATFTSPRARRRVAAEPVYAPAIGLPTTSTSSSSGASSA